MENLPISWADLAVAAVIIISGFFAFVRGFVHEVLSVGSWIGAAIVTLVGFRFAQPVAREYIPIELLADITAGVTIFLVVLIVLSLLTRLLAKRVQNSSLNALDRSLGLVFGFARGALLVCLAWIAFTWVMPKDDWPEWIQEARSRPLIEEVSNRLTALLPEDLLEQGEEAGQKAAEQAPIAKEYIDLLSPLAKGDANDGEPAYKDDERGQIPELIEQSIQEGEQSGESAQ